MTRNTTELWLWRVAINSRMTKPMSRKRSAVSTITAAKQLGDTVSLCELPPRMNSINATEAVHALNIELKELAKETECGYVETGQVFHLANGSPNDGYMDKDNIYINLRGGDKLVECVQIKLKEKTEKSQNLQPITKRTITHNRRNNSQSHTPKSPLGRHKKPLDRSLQSNSLQLHRQSTRRNQRQFKQDANQSQTLTGKTMDALYQYRRNLTFVATAVSQGIDTGTVGVADRSNAINVESAQVKQNSVTIMTR